MYDDPRQPSRAARPPQGQRCPGCGHTEPDLAARFCGGCGASLPGLQSHGQPQGYHGPSDVTGQVPAQRQEPPARYGVPAQPVPMAPGVPGQPAGVPSPQYGYATPAASAAGSIKYTIPSVGFAGPARLGAAVSAAFTLVPCVIFASLGAWGVHAGRRLLDSWLTASIPIPIPIAPINLPMNFVDLLRLRPFYDSLIYWDDRLWLTFAILLLAPWILWIVAGALFALLLAAIYNMVGAAGGGMSVRLSPSDRLHGAPPQPAAWTPAPQPGWPADRRG